jgi:Zn-dependent protease
VPKAVTFNRRIRFKRLTEVMRVRGVPVYIHWSVFLIAAFFILGSLRSPWMALIGGTCWMGVILLHESGHLIAAHRKKCLVYKIELYPLWGLTFYESAWSRVDKAVIAWGGVVAQAVVAIPCILWILTFGYTRFQPVNLVLAFCGFYSLLVAAFNLLPVVPLDGSKAWDLFPALYARAKERRDRKKVPLPRYRSLR